MTTLTRPHRTTYVATETVYIDMLTGPVGGIEVQPGDEVRLEHGDDGPLWYQGERFPDYVGRQFRRAVADGRLVEAQA